MEIYEQTYSIDSRDVDGHAQCRPSALLGYLQEAATGAAEQFGFGRELLMERYGAVWVVTRTMYRLDRPLFWNDELTLQTWHRGGKGAIMYRDYDLFSGGERIGEAVSAWVLMHLDTGRIEKLSKFTEFARNYGEDRCKDVVLTKLRFPVEPSPVETRVMRYSDTDINGHVNNTRYADFACDTVRLEEREKNEFVSRLQIDFLAQCWPGETMELLSAVNGDSRYVVGRDREEKGRFEALLTLDNQAVTD